MQIIYVAVRKGTKQVMSGQHGQYAYGSPATLSRSIGYAYKWTASNQGVKPSELYDILEVDVDKLIAQGESE